MEENEYINRIRENPTKKQIQPRESNDQAGDRKDTKNGAGMMKTSKNLFRPGPEPEPDPGGRRASCWRSWGSRTLHIHATLSSVGSASSLG